VDLRNVYDPARVTQFGFRHISVGRPTRHPASPLLQLEEAVAAVNDFKEERSDSSLVSANA
jgi:hypothetical protein